MVGGEKSFASDRMAKECVFTQVFGIPGEYRWVDANGSGLSGTITVIAPPIRDEAGFERWRRHTGEGVLVMIDGADAKPADVQVLVGQTLFFAVNNAPGITITDARLVEREPKNGSPRTRAKASKR